MSLTIAQRHAWSLARTLMVCVTLFHAGKGYGAVPTSEFDGDADSIVLPGATEPDCGQTSRRPQDWNGR